MIGGYRDTAEVRARIALSRLTEPANIQLGELVRQHGAATVLADLQSESLQDAQLQAQLQSRLERLDVAAELSWLAALGGRVVCPGDEEGSACVDYLGDRAPLVLFVRG